MLLYYFFKVVNIFKAIFCRLGFQFVIVPSQRDFLHEPVFPQPPFRKFSPVRKSLSSICLHISIHLNYFEKYLIVLIMIVILLVICNIDFSR